MSEFLLTGPRGDNPLGFLTALGALAVLHDAGCKAALGWDGFRPRLEVELPVGAAEGAINEETEREALVHLLLQNLRRQTDTHKALTDASRKAMERAKTDVKQRKTDIKKRGLARDAAREARSVELEPLEAITRDAEAVFKESLCKTATDPLVTLGKNLTETNTHFIEFVHRVTNQSAQEFRRYLDIACAYGVADPGQPNDRMLATPWALIKGTSRQDFLVTVQELMLLCTAGHFDQALFGPWVGRDEKYSLRLDPFEDRRYAFLDRNPSGDGNQPLTLWGANRLAFEALRFFPAFPVHSGLGVMAWASAMADNADGQRVRWPLWPAPVCRPVVQTLLGLSDVWSDQADAINQMRARGITTVIESHRISVGDGAGEKYNMTTGTPVWVTSVRR